MQQKAIVAFALCSSFLCGCSSRDPNWKETIPVTGQIFVDGKPAEGVSVQFNPVDGMDTEQPTFSSSMTNVEGSFAASTYQPGDGIPEGKYKVTFTWGKLNPISMTFDGDKFKGKYRDPKKSDFEIDVASGSPVDMGRIDLEM